MICCSGVLAIDMHLSVIQSGMLAPRYSLSVCAAVGCWPEIQCLCLCCSGMLPNIADVYGTGIQSCSSDRVIIHEMQGMFQLLACLLKDSQT